MKTYILDSSGEPVLEPNPVRYAYTMASRNFADRVVAQHDIGESRVSTVFLGIDHNFFGEGPPVLWETMVFGGPLNDHQERYTSRADALAGHISVLRVLAEPTGKPFIEVAVAVAPVGVEDPQKYRTIYDRLLEDDD